MISPASDLVKVNLVVEVVPGVIYIMKSEAKIVTASQQSNNFVKYHQSIRYLHRTHCLQLSDLTKTNIFTAINL